MHLENDQGLVNDVFLSLGCTLQDRKRVTRATVKNLWSGDSACLSY